MNGYDFWGNDDSQQGANKGKGKVDAFWKKVKFVDGQINNLALYQPENNVDACCYVHREIFCATGFDLPVFAKRRFQHGAVSVDRLRQQSLGAESEYRKQFLELYN